MIEFLKNFEGEMWFFLLIEWKMKILCNRSWKVSRRRSSIIRACRIRTSIALKNFFRNSRKNHSTLNQWIYFPFLLVKMENDRRWSISAFVEKKNLFVCEEINWMSHRKDLFKMFNWLEIIGKFFLSSAKLRITSRMSETFESRWFFK